MGTPAYMRSVVDRNVVMRLIPYIVENYTEFDVKPSASQSLQLLQLAQ
jgi:hypothetical protein